MATKELKKAKLLKVKPGAVYATGKRKSAIARLWIFEGKGEISVNNKQLTDVYENKLIQNKILQPLSVLNLTNKYDIKVTLRGGGVMGQIDAFRLALARVLEKVNETFRAPLKKEQLLTRDSRVKERKKYGRKKARKGFQYRKR